MAFKASLLALPLLMTSTVLAGQVSTPDPPAPDAAETERPFSPCIEMTFCPDPMKLDSEYPPFAEGIVEPEPPRITYKPG